LVARIEAAVVPLGATVTSPDRLPDRTTGQVREVDATIRYRLGTSDVLIVIECRKRSRTQDVTWIEQLATKSQSVGANKLIAVSETRFSAAAEKAAQAHQIELRTLSPAPADYLAGWFIPQGIVAHAVREAHDLECVVFLKCADGEAHHQGLLAPDCFVPIFHHDLVSSPFPAALLFSFLEMQQPESFASVPLDGAPKELTFRFQVVPGQLLLEGREGNYEVHHIRLSAKVRYEIAASKTDDGQHKLYSLPTGEQYRHSTFEGTMFGRSVTFEHLQTPAGNVMVSLRLLPYNVEDDA
jgi:hypothetical protein